ncbi:MAG: LytTR family DNA-binding domain-containing protein [Leptospirales bacterium]
MTESDLNSILAKCQEPKPRRYTAENATAEDIEILRNSVFEFEPGIIYWYESAHQTPWSLNQKWQRRKEVGADIDSFVQIVDLSRAGRPDAEARKFLKQVAADPKVAFCFVFTEKNLLINAAAKFVFSSVMQPGAYMVSKKQSTAIDLARQRLAATASPVDDQAKHLDSLLEHVNEITLGSCSITEDQILAAAEINEDYAQLLSGLLFMHEETENQKRNTTQPKVEPTAEPTNVTLNGKSCFLRKGKSLIKVALIDIIWFEALGDYVVIKTKKETFKIHMTMKKLEEKLPSERFVRIHRSFIIAIHKITELRQDEVEIFDEVLPVGSSFRENLLNKIEVL